MTSTDYALRPSTAPASDAQVAWPWPAGIPTPRFGRDHWSTFAYLETRVVDFRGRVEHDHLRCDPARHPFMVMAGRRASVVGAPPGPAFPTRLKGLIVGGEYEIVNQDNHDDYDCITDLAAAGLVLIHMPVADVDADVFRGAHGKVVTTPEGDIIRPSFCTGMNEQILAAHATFEITDAGWVVAAQFREHRAKGGNSHQFDPIEG